MSGTITDRIDGISTSVAVKAPVKVCATGNISLIGEQTIDGVAVVSGDRVFLPLQTDATARGIYDVSTSAWKRSGDFDGARDIVQGTLIPVNLGTVNGGKLFKVSSANPMIIGTTALAFEVIALLDQDYLTQINDAVTDAEDAATQSEISATNASNSAAAASAALAGIPDNDVVFLTFSDSPYSATSGSRGKVLSIDTAGGNVIVNLAQISTLTMPYTLRVMKTSSDANTITINRGGTDLIGGATSYQISNVSGVYLIGDTDGTPDRWSVAPFGAGAGEVKRKVFNVVTDFTIGAPAVLQLDAPYPASDAGIWFDQDGIIQKPTHDFTYNSTTGQITTVGNVETNTLRFQAQYQASSLPIGVTGDGTVTWAKLASGLIASVAEMFSGAANKLISAANFKTYMDTYTLGIGQTWQSVTRLNGTTYTNSTNRPIVFALNQVATNGTFNVSVAGTSVITMTNPTGSGMVFSVIIPVGATYVWTGTGTGNFVELR